MTKRRNVQVTAIPSAWAMVVHYSAEYEPFLVIGDKAHTNDEE